MSRETSRETSSSARSGWPCFFERRWARTRTSAAAAEPPISTAATGRPQLRGSRIAASSQSASSSKATAASPLSRTSMRSDSDADGSTGASAVRSSCSMSKFASAIMLQVLLELTNRPVYQHLRRTFGAAQRPGDLTVVHVECEAHDQRRLPVLGQICDAGQNVTQFLASLDQLVGAVLLGQRTGVIEIRLRSTRAVAEVVCGQVVDDPDEPGAQRPPVRFGDCPLEMTVGLEERLFSEVLRVVVVGDAVIRVAVDVAQVRAVELGELSVQRRLVDGSHGASLTTLRLP